MSFKFSAEVHKQIKEKIVNKIKKSMAIVFSPAVLNLVAKELALEIEARSRLGVMARTSGGKESKMPRLRKATIEHRKYLQGKGKLATETGPATSNITMTGQLTENIKGESPGPRKLRVFIKDEIHKLTKVPLPEIASYLHYGTQDRAISSKPPKHTKSGKPTKKKNKNSTVKGIPPRYFMNLSGKQITRINRTIKAALLKYVDALMK